MNDYMTKIADHLLLKTPYMKDIGLFHGKMGDVYTTECNWLNEACIKVSEDGKTAKTGKCVPASYNPAILVCDTGL